VTWSAPAAIRALRAMVIVPGLFALCFEVIGNQQMTVYATFGSFAALLFANFGGSRRDKAIAHLALALVGGVALTIGTLVSGSTWLATLATIPVAFAIFFAGVAGPNAANGVTAALLAYVLPVASTGTAGIIGWRLAGWLLAQAVATTAIVLFPTRSPGDQLRSAAVASARAQASHLEAAVAGTATQQDLDASRAAKFTLMEKFNSTPYRPTGLATADQALAHVIHMLEWCAALTCDAMGGHLDLSRASEQDRRVLSESAAALRAVAALLGRHQTEFELRPMWHARIASAERMRQLSGPAPAISAQALREQVGYAFHAQAIGLAASAAAADAMIASGRPSRDLVEQERRRWVDGLPDDLPSRRSWRLADLVVTDASLRSVWFRNSARGAVALAGAVAVARLTGVQHGFWVVLGTLSVLRTNAAATGSTALRALGGTAIGFAIGAALLIGIGTSQPALWAALPIAVLVSAYAPGTAPFAAGQAAFTVTVVVLFNLLVPAGWRVGLIRIEDVALGVAVSVVVGILFWPRGSSTVVGDNLADALRGGADYLTESARWALDLGKRHQAHAVEAITAGIRLDDAIRAYLNEQGSKRLAKADLWTLVMASQRIRLTSHSLASLPTRAERRNGGAMLGPRYRDLSGFYHQIATQVGPQGEPTQIPVPPELTAAYPTPIYDPDTLWVEMHLEQLGSHAAALPGPAARLARVRRTAWWRAPDGVAWRRPRSARSVIE
jgi:uncharacterized membrane protein YccC